MIYLCMDTSAKTASVALCEGEKVLVEVNAALGLTHSETLFPCIETVLRLASTSIEKVEALAVVVGPGSFTGLRIGVSAAKTMAYAKACPVYPVSSLAALAASLPLEGAYVAVSMDARNQRVFGSLYHEGLALIEERALPYKEWLPRLVEALPQGAPLHIVGEAAGWLDEEDEALLLSKASAIFRLPELHLRAGALGGLAERARLQGLSGDPHTLLPSYLVASQAERMRQRDGK